MENHGDGPAGTEVPAGPSPWFSSRFVPMVFRSFLVVLVNDLRQDIGDLAVDHDIGVAVGVVIFLGDQN